MRRFFLLSSLLLAACINGAGPIQLNKDIPMNPITEAKQNLTFTCAHETIPEPSAEADVLFQYARWLQKNNQLKPDEAVDIEIERLYRIAAENGHYKANINLQNGSMRGRFKLRGDEYLRLSQQLIDAGVATGYYYIGFFLRKGTAGLKQDEEMALRYFRKAADQGSAQAQTIVGDMLAPIGIAPAIARQMFHCAAQQGSGAASVDLGIDHMLVGEYEAALEAFQLGVAAGSSSSASRLSNSFRNPSASDGLYYLDVQEDLERADRYEKIWNILADYSYADPKVPEINEILPLPPAKLPAWDGKLQWLEARLANVPPEKPSEALIRQLAKAKLLEPATGRATPDSPAFIKVGFPAPTCSSGQPCPQTGYWEAASLSRDSYSSFKDRVIRRFEENEIMPTLKIQSNEPRFLLPDKVTVNEEGIEWRLLG